MLLVEPVSYPSVKAKILKMQSGYFFLNSFKDLEAVMIASYTNVEFLGAAVETNLLKS